MTAVTAGLIDRLDAHFPDRLEAFYLVGSIALGDFQEAVSDVDFVAVLEGEPDLAILAVIHAELARDHPDLHCDGIYLRSGELSRPPGGVGVELRDGRLLPASPGERHPVTWLILADHGVVLRGRPPDDSWIMADREAARQHSRINMQTYWRAWLAARRRLLSPSGLSLLGDKAVAWGCLGIARLHATIATGAVPSKTAAGRHALKAFPGHARIIEEAVRLRNDPLAPAHYRSRQERRREMIAFMDAVLASAR